MPALGGMPVLVEEEKSADTEVVHWTGEYGGFLGLGDAPPYVADLQTLRTPDTAVLRAFNAIEAVTSAAALSLGAEQSTAVTNQIRNTFGLDELSVAAGNTVRDTSLVAGKRLSPKVSVRTDFNPFDQFWSFFLNYKLTPRWSVEAESGGPTGRRPLRCPAHWRRAVPGRC